MIACSLDLGGINFKIIVVDFGSSIVLFYKIFKVAAFVSPTEILKTIKSTITKLKVSHLSIGCFGPITLTDTYITSKNNIITHINKGSVFSTTKSSAYNINILSIIDPKNHLKKLLFHDCEIGAFAQNATAEFTKLFRSLLPQINKISAIHPIASSFPETSEDDITSTFSCFPTIKSFYPSCLKNDTTVYITVGTGVGFAIVQNSSPIKICDEEFSKKELLFRRSIEAGHMTIKRFEEDSFAGACPLHGDCIEGLISCIAIAKRLGIPHEDLKEVEKDNSVWPLVGKYLGRVCYSLFLLFNPGRIVIGGGLLNRRFLVNLAKEQFLKENNCYLDSNYGFSQDFIEECRFGSLQGLTGGLLVLYNKYASKKSIE